MLSSQSQEKERESYGLQEKNNKDLNCLQWEGKQRKAKAHIAGHSTFLKNKEGKDWEFSSPFPNPKLSWLIPTSLSCAEFWSQPSCLLGSCFCFPGRTGSMCSPFKPAPITCRKNYSFHLLRPLARSVGLGTLGCSKFFMTRVSREGAQGWHSGLGILHWWAGLENRSCHRLQGCHFVIVGTAIVYYTYLVKTFLPMFPASNGLLLWNINSSESDRKIKTTVHATAPLLN